MVVNKTEAAKIQLDAAIEHFFIDDHVCTVTLAGAADDILDDLMEASGEQGVFNFLHGWYENRTEQKVKKSTFSREMVNQARNWLKHSRDDHDTECEITKRDSLLMLMRAIGSYRRLMQKETKQTLRFDKWYQSNQSEVDELIGFKGE